MLCVWGAIFGVVYTVARRSRVSAAVTIALLVVSHWVLDFITHRPDMPLTPVGDTHVGLELWASESATVVVEAIMFTLGVALYLRTTKALDRVGSIGLWAFLVFLCVTYLANVFGPVPPSAGAVVWSAQAMWLLMAWAYWVDAHRRAEG